MYVIYYGIGNSFAGSLAANLHLNTIPYSKSIHPQLILAVPSLLDLEEMALGRLLFIGDDEDNNQVFLLNAGHAETIVLPALKSVFDILQVSQNRMLLIDTTEMKSSVFLLGRFFYLFRMKKLGEYFMMIGIKKFYWQIVDIVSATKQKTKT